MIRNYLLITFRGMIKNKLFIAINVFGMGIAIACCIVGYLAYHYDTTFDSAHINGDRVYRVSAVREFDDKTTRYGHAPLPLREVVDKTFNDVDKSSRYLQSWSNFKREDDLFPSSLMYVDPEFFQMFSFEFIAGSGGALNDETAVLVSETMAVRLFNSPQEAFGKTLTQVYSNELKEVRIAGVFREQPANSSFYKREGSAYMSAENYKDEHPLVREDDWTQEGTLFVQIDDAATVSKVHAQLQPFRENNNKVRDDFQISELALDRFSTMAYSDRTDGVLAKTWAAPPYAAIIGAMIMSTLILLIACFNLTNTAIALSSRRLKEIGIRKVMGSMRLQLIMQFIGETTCTCFLALLVGLGISDFLVAGWNIMTANNIHLTPSPIVEPGFILFLGGVLLFTGLLAGSYPAFYISKFQPVHILKGRLKFGGTNYFTRTLLGLQFAISMIAIVSAIGFFQNARYQRTYDLGFDAHGSVIAWVSDKAEFDTYRNALQENPSIRAIAGAKTGIFSDRAHDPVKYESKQVEVDVIEVGDNYLNTMDLELLQGRDFIKDSETDRRESVIITQKMAALFGWDKPLGKTLIWKDSTKVFVVGVVKDVYTHGLWKELEPMMIKYVLPADYRQLVVNTDAGNVSEVNAFMNEKWATVFPNRLYNGRMLDNDLREINDLNLSIMYVYAFLGIIATLLSATGLFSLLSLNIVKRMKEIGVRKVLGASAYNISRVINFEFMIIFTVACTLGCWAAFNWTTIILGSIWKYYQGVNALTFIAAIGTLLLVSLITIGYKVFSVATMNPVKILRDE